MASHWPKAAALISFGLGAMAMIVPWRHGRCREYWNRYQCNNGHGANVWSIWDSSRWADDMARTSAIFLVAAVAWSFFALWQILVQEGRHEAGHFPSLAAGLLYLLAGFTWMFSAGEPGA